jgi:outer membrane immunogenic protein
MVKTLLAGTALCLVSFGAVAADLPARMPTKAPVYVAPAFSWTGFYVGAHVGYGWGTHDTELLDEDHKSNGILGGFQAGYNLQAGNAVFGIEADWSFSGVKSDDRVVFTAGAANSTTDIEHKLAWLATLRARLGYSFGNVLPYVTGGLAYGEMKSSASAVNTGFGAPFDGTFAGSDTQRHFGWVVGGGVEFAISSNWSAKAEYLHVDLGTEHYLALPVLDPVPRSHDLVVDIVRVGLNYRFGGAPVVARY